MLASLEWQMSQESMQPNVQVPHFQELHQSPAILNLDFASNSFTKTQFISRFCEILENKPALLKPPSQNPAAAGLQHIGP